MKLTELLSRYLCVPRRRSRDRRRNTTLTRSSVAIQTLVDATLEPRLLLSGTGAKSPDVDSKTVEPAAVDSPAGSSDPFDRFAIVAGDATYSNGQFRVVATGDAASHFDDSLLGISAAFDSPTGAEGNRNLAANQGAYLITSASTSDGLDYFNFSVREQNSSIVVDANDIGRLLESGIDPFQGNSPESDSSSQTEFHTIAAQLPEALATPRSAAGSIDFVSGAGTIDPSDRSAVATSDRTSSKTVDAFFSTAGSPRWMADTSDAPLIGHTAPVTQRPSVTETPQGISQRTIREQEESASLTLNSSGKSVGAVNSKSTETSVFSTADSKSSFATLFNSFVQFDTSLFLDTNEDLSDWLSDQLMLNPVDAESQGADAANATTPYADSHTATDNVEEIERLQQAFVKIDYLANTDATVSVLSDGPGDSPEVVGIWQRLRFDCNPRGPPVSDNISSSDFIHSGASAVQLEQLRYCIAPRGPSAVSAN